MISLHTVDRIAAAAILCVSVAIPAAAFAAPDAPRQTLSVSARLGEDAFYKIRAGMQASEVLALLGAPGRKMRWESTKTTSWDYNFTDAWGYASEFSVLIDDEGFVVSKVTTRLTP
jgi:hypothetical protein